jgi:uncharacterized SAM-binding protein YcdF (DUF218 family)
MTLRSILALPLTPLPLFFLLLLVAIWFRHRNKHRPAHILAILSLIWLIAICTEPLPRLSCWLLERQYPVLITPPSSPATDTIFVVVLGAGYKENPARPAINKTSLAGLARLAEGIRLFRQLPGPALLVTSGFGGDEPRSNAEIQRNAAVELGVSPSSIAILPLPQNTRYEALQFRQRFGTNRTVILVTDAVHLPRSVLWFKRTGQRVLPAPANHWVKSMEMELPYCLLPNANNVKGMEIVMHEWVGLAFAILIRA